MFISNPTNNEASSQKERTAIQSSANLSSLPQSSFKNLEQFSAWLDQQLEQLESRFGEFETHASVRGHFDR